MPRGTKLQRSGKLAGLRRVYVSWLEPGKAKQHWITSFWTRLKVATAQKEELFEAPMQTGDAPPGEVFGRWLDPKARNSITDVVGVLTDEYMAVNTGAKAEGELAGFFDRVLADPDDRLRVHLAPVDPPEWSYRVRGVTLGDREKKWLHRLKEGDRPFVWPGQNGPKAAAEIAEAVAKVVNNAE